MISAIVVVTSFHSNFQEKSRRGRLLLAGHAALASAGFIFLTLHGRRAWLAAMPRAASYFGRHAAEFRCIDAYTRGEHV